MYRKDLVYFRDSILGLRSSTWASIVSLALERVPTGTRRSRNQDELDNGSALTRPLIVDDPSSSEEADEELEDNLPVSEW